MGSILSSDSFHGYVLITATSKFRCLADMDVGVESLSFRGEALGSLSDVCLLEVITKAQGKPNGYRKVIKACIIL